MERNYHATTSVYVHPDELDWRTAFHEAGHAAAIYLGNRRKQLPPVFFEIRIKRPVDTEGAFFAKVVDGNLINNLPIAGIETLSNLTGYAQHSCQRAYEADIVNLLIGPLSEAKYVALRDGEIFVPGLIGIESLSHYGGHSDLEMVSDYLQHFIADKAKRQQKMVELLAEAHRFVANVADWRCIEILANHLLQSGREVIDCDEVCRVISECARGKSVSRR